jgi:hypothetical protein
MVDGIWKFRLQKNSDPIKCQHHSSVVVVVGSTYYGFLVTGTSMSVPRHESLRDYNKK